jgi:hypothetical protein
MKVLVSDFHHEAISGNSNTQRGRKLARVGGPLMFET